ncbi:MAG: hypothetical protein R2706_05365 [Acidimicrobiales bacterium]
MSGSAADNDPKLLGQRVDLFSEVVAIAEAAITTNFQKLDQIESRLASSGVFDPSEVHRRRFVIRSHCNKCSDFDNAS